MSLLNYFVEANLCLAFAAIIFRLLLKNENQFDFLRAFLLIAVAASLTLPLIHLNLSSNPLPTFQNLLTTRLLPEVVVGNSAHVANRSIESTWQIGEIFRMVYIAICLFFILRFSLRITTLVRWIKSSPAIKGPEYSLIESEKNISSFSFFRFIFIGNSNQFSRDEKQQILRHELVHVKKLHSLDILFMELIQFFFWFNPAINSIKKNFKDVHEYQADSIVSSETDPTSYSILMTRMALLSVGFSFANHFNQSQTLNRITMMNAVKTKLSRMKVALISMCAVILVVAIACQDQLMDDAIDMSKNSTMALDLPTEVKEKLSFLQARNPNSEFAVIELNDQGKKKEKQLVEQLQKENKPYTFQGITVFGNQQLEPRNFLIFEYTSQANRLAELSSTDEVFTIVDTPAAPLFGMDEFFKQLSQVLKYPENARNQGKEGRVFVEFIVNKDGALSDFKVVKGFDEECDAAALSAMMLSQKWYPAKHQGKIVKERLVLPITFKL
jgi:TonB family protein